MLSYTFPRFNQHQYCVNNVSCFTCQELAQEAKRSEAQCKEVKEYYLYKWRGYYLCKLNGLQSSVQRKKKKMKGPFRC
ncbi:hypothetical protein K1719_005156 [Acacia pycnantha]|nr:hypothetical protein K1719_005156 [Acacia pycnantha]